MYNLSAYIKADIIIPGAVVIVSLRGGQMLSVVLTFLLK